MSRNRCKSRGQRKPSKGYPVEAIRDFFDQLLWEVRASHFEVCHPEAVSDELVRRIAHYFGKYGQALLPLVVLHDRHHLPPEQINAVLADLRAKIKNEREEQLRHLEALRPLIAKALDTAQNRPLR